MTQVFLGVDVGATKTAALLADENGHLLGYGLSGGGNPTGVGYERFAAAVETAVTQALGDAQLSASCVAAAGLGVAGCDWPSQTAVTLAALTSVTLPRSIALVNDALLGLFAAGRRGWGVSLVAGTGCNCRGRDANGRYGRVVGDGDMAGEYAGAAELVNRAYQKIVHQWTKRGRPTLLAPAFIAMTNAPDLDAFIEGVSTRRITLSPEAARLVFDCAAQGDPVALDLLQWAGRELGEMTLAVARQLHLQQSDTDVILSGGLFKGAPPLQPILSAYLADAMPNANFIRLAAPPVVGAVRLAMEQGGMTAPAIIDALSHMNEEAKASFEHISGNLAHKTSRNKSQRAVCL